MGTIHKGAVLKQSREEKGISLETVHESTKIPLDALRAIEEGYSIRNLSPFYFRGFMKIYAQYLGLEINTILDQLPAQKQTQPMKMDESVSLFEIIGDRIDQFLTHRRKRQMIKIVGILLAALIVFKLAGLVMGKRPTTVAVKNKATVKNAGTLNKDTLAKQKKEEKIKKPEAGKVETKSVVTQPPPPTANVIKEPVVAVVAPVVPAVFKNVELTVLAKKKNWVQVKVDGDIVFQSVLKKGTAEHWTADENIVLTGKNLQYLEFEVNGKFIGLLGEEDRRASEVVITKNGLSVKK